MKHVLIIDDQKEVRHVLQRAIASFGYEVHEAENGRDGIRVSREIPLHLILTDIFMPEQDGLETIRSLRKLCRDVPIIAMSGGGDMGHLDVLRIARAMGAVQVLAKPFSMQKLREVLSAVMQEDNPVTPRES